MGTICAPLMTTHIVPMALHGQAACSAVPESAQGVKREANTQIHPERCKYQASKAVLQFWPVSKRCPPSSL